MKTYLKLLFLLVITLIPSLGRAEDLPAVKATAAILINSETNEVLYSKNSHQKMAPASTTKIMTAILALENGDLNQKIKISYNAATKPPTSMHLHQGEEQTLRNLLYGLLLSSGNDAATAIAEGIAGTEAKFAGMMNEKAKELGMQDTNFKNASGLPAEGHYTTAYDLAILTSYALKNRFFAEIVQTKVATVPNSRSRITRPLTNHNKLLWQYPYTTGVKTGYTRKAGRCLVASACQNKITLISVVLKSDTMYNDSIRLFNYGFSNLTVKAE